VNACLDDLMDPAPQREEDLIALDHALNELEAIDSRKGGRRTANFCHEATADVLKLSVRSPRSEHSGGLS
jgi:hypothetical protein